MNNENKILEMLSTLVDNMNKLNERVDSLTKEVKEINQRLDRMEHIQEFHSAELEGLKFTNAEMHGDIKTIQNKLENMDINIKDIQLNQAVLEKRQHHVEKDVASIELRIKN